MLWYKLNLPAVCRLKAPWTKDSFLQVTLQAVSSPQKNKVFEHLHLDGELLTKSADNQELQERWNEAAKKKYKLQFQSPMIQSYLHF